MSMACLRPAVPSVCSVSAAPGPLGSSPMPAVTPVTSVPTASARPSRHRCRPPPRPSRASAMRPRSAFGPAWRSTPVSPRCSAAHTSARRCTVSPSWRRWPTAGRCSSPRRRPGCCSTRIGRSSTWAGSASTVRAGRSASPGCSRRRCPTSPCPPARQPTTPARCRLIVARSSGAPPMSSAWRRRSPGTVWSPSPGRAASARRRWRSPSPVRPAGGTGRARGSSSSGTSGATATSPR